MAGAPELLGFVIEDLPRGRRAFIRPVLGKRPTTGGESPAGLSRRQADRRGDKAVAQVSDFLSYDGSGSPSASRLAYLLILEDAPADRPVRGGHDGVIERVGLALACRVGRDIVNPSDNVA